LWLEKAEGGGWRMGIRGRKTEVGNMRMEDRGWKIKNGEWRTANNKKIFKKISI
jgi:hypothetical protein